MCWTIKGIGDSMFCDRTDEQLCALAASGSARAEEEIILRYTRLVKVCARQFFIVGGESEDLIQEGMIGLYKAIRDFKTDANTSFKSFAELCIIRQIITAIMTEKKLLST